jgi:uncharacterized membrane protein YcaP (DUF421 family)
MTLTDLFGEGTDLTILQMSFRGILFFIAAWVLIRISGRRSFGLRTPVDNIIAIGLGSILIRAVVGASPALPVFITCLVIVILHRFVTWLISKYPAFCRLVEGEKILLYSDNQFNKKGLDAALASKEDVMQGVRNAALTENMDKIDKIYMERNGEISPLKKE